MFSAAALILTLGLVEPEPMTPTVSADLDGDGTAETATALASRGGVSLEIRNAKGKTMAKETAPAPAAQLVHVSLTAAALGSTGSLLDVLASTDASECRSVWRYHDRALTRIPIQDAAGHPLPDCAAPGGWSHRWEREAAEAPSVLVRERSETVERGTLRRRDVFAFAGFSLNADPKRSGAEINGIPIPSWYEARLYTRTGLEALYKRFEVATLRAEPQLRILADRERGVFALRFQTSEGEIVAPVEAYAFVPSEAKASLVLRTGEKTFRASVQLGGGGSVPTEVRVEGLGRLFDVIFAPAGSWKGSVRQVYPSAADEIASQYLTAQWSGAQGAVQIENEGAPPYRVRIGKALFTLDMDQTPPATDFVLLPADGSGHAWAIVLRGPNALVRTPMACAAGGAPRECRPEGAGETLRRVGARINVN
ncbi:MAG: hypothetical protein ABI968_05425 [Acidobacteriota bacterium]